MIKFSFKGMKVRDKIGVSLMLFFIFVFIPFIIIKYQINSYHLEERGVRSKATVTKVVGSLSSYTHTYRYEVDGKFYEGMGHRASKKVGVGQQLNIIYDSLDCETCRIIWYEK